MTPTFPHGTRDRIFAFTLIVLSVFSLTSCLSYQRQGDHAFEEGKCSEALELYQRAAEAGTKDPEMFRRAAECALDGGDFAAAERYYSQALRYGAGIEVARELADFYIKTSNYASAIRVYQYLLRRESEKQPVYNNLGTALMYAGHHFDAESYLMIAQQMRPEDPTPYLNLGVLYDRHLRQPWLAINFYDCFVELNQGDDERVAQRINELRAKWSRLYEPGVVKCGKPYEPRAAEPVADLEKALAIEGEETDDEEKTEDDGDDETADRVASADEKSGGEEPSTQPIAVETMVSTEESPPQKKTRRPSEEDEDTSDEASLEKAREAFEDRRWAETISLISSVPLSRLGPEERRLLGLAYLNQANWSQATQWLERARQDEETPEVIDGLLVAYRRSNDWNRVASLCKKYGNQPEYEKITKKRCKLPAMEPEQE